MDKSPQSSERLRVNRDWWDLEDPITSDLAILPCGRIGSGQCKNWYVLLWFFGLLVLWSLRSGKCQDQLWMGLFYVFFIVRSRKNIFRTPQEMEPSCQNDRLNQGFPFAVLEWSDSKDWLGQFDRIEGSIRTSLWQYRRYFCCLKLLPYCSMCPMTQPSQIGIDRSCIWILVSFSMVYVSYQTDMNKNISNFVVQFYSIHKYTSKWNKWMYSLNYFGYFWDRLLMITLKTTMK